MIDMDKEERIRCRAYELWERQGKPEDRQEEHWHQARDEIEMENEDAAGLERTVTETIGLTVGTEPEKEQQMAVAYNRLPEPVEGDRGTVERELSRTKATSGHRKRPDSG